MSLRPWPPLSADFAASHKFIAGLEARAFGAFLPRLQTYAGARTSRLRLQAAFIVSEGARVRLAILVTIKYENPCIASVIIVLLRL